MTLRDTPEGAHVRLTRLRLSEAVTFRLREMGLRPGAVARVVLHTAFGGRVVAVAGTRYAIDARTAALIDVEPIGSLDADAIAGSAGDRTATASAVVAG
ncbi:MAG TPA: FeoA family protein [Cellulomonadaceae bacterium]|nr:FeoA family protein [Cellulomonadaceae bacterium]